MLCCCVICIKGCDHQCWMSFYPSFQLDLNKTGSFCCFSMWRKDRTYCRPAFTCRYFRYTILSLMRVPVCASVSLFMHAHAYTFRCGVQKMILEIILTGHILWGRVSHLPASHWLGQTVWSASPGIFRLRFPQPWGYRHAPTLTMFYMNAAGWAHG